MKKPKEKKKPAPPPVVIVLPNHIRLTIADGTPTPEFLKRLILKNQKGA